MPRPIAGVHVHFGLGFREAHAPEANRNRVVALNAEEERFVARGESLREMHAEIRADADRTVAFLEKPKAWRVVLASRSSAVYLRRETRRSKNGGGKWVPNGIAFWPQTLSKILRYDRSTPQFHMSRRLGAAPSESMQSSLESPAGAG